MLPNIIKTDITGDVCSLFNIFKLVKQMVQLMINYRTFLVTDIYLSSDFRNN